MMILYFVLLLLCFVLLLMLRMKMQDAQPCAAAHALDENEDSLPCAVAHSHGKWKWNLKEVKQS